MMEINQARKEINILFNCMDEYWWTGNPARVQNFVMRHELAENSTLAELLDQFVNKYNLDFSIDKKGRLIIREIRPR